MRGRFGAGLLGVLVIGLLFGAASLSASLLGWGCPVQHFTGVPCPGCGLSRAVYALLRLDFAAAFRYHPMVYVLPPVVLYVLFGKKPLLGSKTRERGGPCAAFLCWINPARLLAYIRYFVVYYKITGHISRRKTQL